MLDAKQLCIDYGIDYAKNGHHYRNGWVNVACQFCSGNPGYHLGINIEEAFSVCHRCGWHTLNEVISSLTNSNFRTAKDIINKYSTDTTHVRHHKEVFNPVTEINFPSGTNPLTKKATTYLIERKYNPDELISKWGLLSTSHYGFYKHRILAPIYLNGNLVSYQCRSISNNNPNKYLPCPQNEEVLEHQKCIYGMDSTSNRKCIVVEGITDVWRLGRGAVATFGISFTKQQTRMIARNFDRVFIMYDGEEQAQEQAEKLGYLIGNSFANSVEVINLPFLVKDIDPGDLSQDDADALMKEVGLR